MNKYEQQKQTMTRGLGIFSNIKNGCGGYINILQKILEWYSFIIHNF